MKKALVLLAAVAGIAAGVLVWRRRRASAVPDSLWTSAPAVEPGVSAPLAAVASSGADPDSGGMSREEEPKAASVKAKEPKAAPEKAKSPKAKSGGGKSGGSKSGGSKSGGSKPAKPEPASSKPTSAKPAQAKAAGKKPAATRPATGTSDPVA